MTSQDLPAVAGIRVVAPALARSDVVALGEFETRAHLYHLDPLEHVAVNVTVLDSGGHRLALCTPGDALVIVAAAWERHGVCGYDAATGGLLWQRKDLKRAGRLAPAADGSLVAVPLDRRAMHVLDAYTGRSAARVRAADGLWQSRYGSLAVVSWYQQLAMLDTRSWARSWTASVVGFTMVDAAFAPDGLLASDTGDVGWVYAFGLDGRELWRHRLPDDMLCWALAWDDAADEWMGLAHNVNRSSSDLLFRWERNGRLRSTISLASVTAAAFVPGGHKLVTERDVIDTRTGAAVPWPTPMMRSGDIGRH